MANGYFERGEIYWVRMDSGFGYEQGVGRPGVILSTNKQNTSGNTVTIAFCSKQPQKAWEIEIEATGVTSYVKCAMINTVDKTRLGKCIGVLTGAEMKELEDTLEDYFELGYVDDATIKAKDKEIEALKAQIVELTGEVAREQAKNIELSAKHEDELLSYKVENAMWQKCYDKALSQLVDMKVNGDLSRKVPIKVEVPKQPEKLELVVEPVKDERVDINHCTQTQLKKIGMSDGLARSVVAKRPFGSVADLKNVPGMNGKKFQIFEPKLCCTPLEIVVLDEETETEVTPLNINGVLAKELHEVTGVSLSQCYDITKYRNDNGAYQNWDDLRKAPRVSDGVIAKLQGKIEFGPMIEIPRGKPGGQQVKKPIESYNGEKVNINTASAEEIHNKTGLNKTVCFSITGCRKRDGLYRSVEDLENVPRFTEAHMKLYGPMFEV